MNSGLRFGKYEVLATIGRGSIGIVYKATDPQLNRLVAIKALKSVFLSNQSGEGQELERFYRESRLAAQLRHPNIVTIFDVGATELGTPFIVMDYIEGPTLRNVLDEQGKLSREAAIECLDQIAGALDYAHGQRVLHRDLNPDNIIFDSKKCPYILDFSLAKVCEVSITPTGAVLGSPGYIAPELITGGRPDAAGDLFSFAVIAFEVFTGSRPFPGDDIIKTAFAVVREQPASFRDLRVDLPENLEQVLLKGLAKKKDQRFRSAKEFVSAIKHALTVAPSDEKEKKNTFPAEEHYVLGDIHLGDEKDDAHGRRAIGVKSRDSRSTNNLLVLLSMIFLLAVGAFFFNYRSPSEESKDAPKSKLDIIAETGSATAKASLIQELLKDRRSDIEALAFYRRMLNDQDYLVRGNAVQALFQFAGTEANGLLEQRLQIEKDPLVRKLISDKLENIKKANSAAKK